MRRFFNGLIAGIFLWTGIFPAQLSYAQVLPSQIIALPAPGTRVLTTNSYTPITIKGLKLHPDNPLMFDFIVVPGDDEPSSQQLEPQSNKLIRYFMAALTVPEDQMWVNLSPYERDRIIPDAFGQTEMGRDLLAQDYLLKQLTASLMYPEDQLGGQFWRRVRQRALAEFGSTEIPMNTFNKVWIVPEKAVVYESGDSVFVVDSHLKVMLEEDYRALKHNSLESVNPDGEPARDSKIISGVSSDIVREILIPEIEREVNQGETFANLRQIYHSVILATWFKNNLKQSVLGQVYVDRRRMNGIDLADEQVNQDIYDQYIKAFEKGVYNYIREEFDEATQTTIPRQYFSGGITHDKFGDVIETAAHVDPALVVEMDRAMLVRTQLDPAGQDSSRMLSDLAMLTTDKRFGTEFPPAIRRHVLEPLIRRLPEADMSVQQKVLTLIRYLELEADPYLRKVIEDILHGVAEQPLIDVVLKQRSHEVLRQQSLIDEVRRLSAGGAEAAQRLNDIWDLAPEGSALMTEAFRALDQVIERIGIEAYAQIMLKETEQALDASDFINFRDDTLELAPRLTRIIGRNIFVDMQSQQEFSSFKVLYYYFLHKNLKDKVGITGASSGNHAVAQAGLGRKLKKPVVVYVSAGVPDKKLRAIKEAGQEYVTIVQQWPDGSPLQDYNEAREAAYQARLEAEQRGEDLLYIPHSSPSVVAGYGLASYSLHKQLQALKRMDIRRQMYVPIGEGGLLMGYALIGFAMDPANFSTMGVSSESYESIRPSLVAGYPVLALEELAAKQAREGMPLLEDGIAIPQLSAYTLLLAKHLVKADSLELVTVTKEQIREGTRLIKMDVPELPVEGSSGVATWAAYVQAPHHKDVKDVIIVATGQRIPEETQREVYIPDESVADAVSGYGVLGEDLPLSEVGARSWRTNMLQADIMSFMLGRIRYQRMTTARTPNQELGLILWTSGERGIDIGRLRTIRVARDLLNEVADELGLVVTEKTVMSGERPMHFLGLRHPDGFESIQKIREISNQVEDWIKARYEEQLLLEDEEEDLAQLSDASLRPIRLEELPDKLEPMVATAVRQSALDKPLADAIDEIRRGDSLFAPNMNLGLVEALVDHFGGFRETITDALSHKEHGIAAILDELNWLLLELRRSDQAILSEDLEGFIQRYTADEVISEVVVSDTNLPAYYSQQARYEEAGIIEIEKGYLSRYLEIAIDHQAEEQKSAVRDEFNRLMNDPRLVGMSLRDIEDMVFAYIRAVSGRDQPMRPRKLAGYDAVLPLLNQFEQKLSESPSEWRLLQAVKWSIAGNYFGSNQYVDAYDGGLAHLGHTIQSYINKEVPGDYTDTSRLAADLDDPDKTNVLYLLDNVVEDIFDLPLIREILASGKQITLVAKQNETDNDAMVEDVERWLADARVRQFLGEQAIQNQIRVISSGSSTRGTDLRRHRLTPEFELAWITADIIILKGEGNRTAIVTPAGITRPVYSLVYPKAKHETNGTEVGVGQIKYFDAAMASREDRRVFRRVEVATDWLNLTSRELDKSTMAKGKYGQQPDIRRRDRANKYYRRAERHFEAALRDLKHHLAHRYDYAMSGAQPEPPKPGRAITATLGLFETLGWTSGYARILAQAADAMDLGVGDRVINIGPSVISAEPVAFASRRASVHIVQPTHFGMIFNQSHGLMMNILNVRDRIRLVSGVDVMNYISFEDNAIQDADIRDDSASAIVLNGVIRLNADRSNAIFRRLIQIIRNGGYVLLGGINIVETGMELQLFESYLDTHHVDFELVRQFEARDMGVHLGYRLYRIHKSDRAMASDWLDPDYHSARRQLHKYTTALMSRILRSRARWKVTDRDVVPVMDILYPNPADGPVPSKNQQRRQLQEHFRATDYLPERAIGKQTHDLVRAFHELMRQGPDLEALVTAGDTPSPAAIYEALYRAVDFRELEREVRQIGYEAAVDEPIGQMLERGYGRDLKPADINRLFESLDMTGRKRILEIGPGINLLSLVAALQGAEVIVVEPSEKYARRLRALLERIDPLIRRAGGSYTVVEGKIEDRQVSDYLRAKPFDQIWALNVFNDQGTLEMIRSMRRSYPAAILDQLGLGTDGDVPVEFGPHGDMAIYNIAHLLVTRLAKDGGKLLINVVQSGRSEDTDVDNIVSRVFAAEGFRQEHVERMVYQSVNDVDYQMTTDALVYTYKPSPLKGLSDFFDGAEHKVLKALNVAIEDVDTYSNEQAKKSGDTKVYRHRLQVKGRSVPIEFYTKRTFREDEATVAQKVNTLGRTALSGVIEIRDQKILWQKRVNGDAMGDFDIQNLDELKLLIEDLGRAVGELHANGIVHYDLENVAIHAFARRDGADIRVEFIDFGESFEPAADDYPETVDGMRLPPYDIERSTTYEYFMDLIKWRLMRDDDSLLDGLEELLFYQQGDYVNAEIEEELRAIYFRGYDQGAEDAAMITDTLQSNPGGIDLDTRNLDLQIQGQGLNLRYPPIRPEQMRQWRIDGFVPVIINIAPVPSVPLMLGMTEDEINQAQSSDDTRGNKRTSQTRLEREPFHIPEEA